MSWIRRLREFFSPRRAERELGDELRFHIEKQTALNLERGMKPEEARLAALRTFGGVEQIKEEGRDLRGLRLWSDLVQDVRYGVRVLAKSPGFATVAIITLALGIGANTGIFSVIDAVMLRALPVEHPEQLVQVAFQGKHSGQAFVGESFSYPLFQKLRQDNQVFTDISAFDYWDTFEAHLATSGAASEPLKGQLVSANFFSMLGVNAALGRTFASDEDNGAGAHPVAVISYALWTRMFARDPAVLGKRLVIEETPFTIIGVAPQHFSGANPGRSCDLWAPVSMQPQAAPSEFSLLTSSDTNWLSLVARLKPGVSMEQARAGLDLVYQQMQRQRDLSDWSAQDRRDFFTHRMVLLPAARGTDYLRREFSRPLWLLMSMVGLVLLIACANVANLLLARGSARQREIAVRRALGAGRGRLVRQLLTESVLLSLAGAALGVLFALWGSPLLVALMTRGQDRLTLDVHPDASVLAFTAMVALATGIAFGLAPALGATRAGGSGPAGAGSRSLTPSRRRRNLGRALVIAQVSLSLALMIGAGLLVRTLRNLETLDPGFRPQSVLLFGFDPTKAGYSGVQADRLREQIRERIERLPGVRAASYSFLTPISGGGWDNVARSVEGYTPQPGEDMDIFLNAVGPRFFETLGTPLVMGRDFGPQDRADSAPVAAINQTMVRRFFGNRSPIGKHFELGPWYGKRAFEIVGVVGDAKYLSLREQAPPTAYLHVPQLPADLTPRGVTVEVRSGGAPFGLVPEMRSLLQSVDSRLTATDVKTLAEQVDQSLYQEKLVSTLSSFFGGLALLLACVGLYSVMAYTVARRTNEIGLRMALGAERRDVLWMVLRESLMVTSVGVVLGLVAAWGATRFVASMLYGVKPTDPGTIASATALLLGVAIGAGYFPARRATKVDPMTALRYE